MRVAQKKVYDASDVAALNAVATRSGRNKSFRLAITVFGLIDLAAAAGAWYEWRVDLGLSLA